MLRYWFSRLFGRLCGRFRVGSDEGSALPLVALLLAAMVMAALLIVVSTDVLVRRARAQAAADAGALAGAAQGRAAARSVVEGNDGSMVDYVEKPGQSPWSIRVVVVAVEVDGVEATAAAERYVEATQFLSGP